MAKSEGFETSIGKGGETHQTVLENGGHLTTNQGMRVSDNQNSLRAGARGPILLEDFVLREKSFTSTTSEFQNASCTRVVPLRTVILKIYESLAEITKADLFQRPGETIPLFTRFSTVAGGAGSVDTPRDVRGFAVKFYTKEGNWDLVGNNIPLFFV
jgi:catalase